MAEEFRPAARKHVVPELRPVLQPEGQRLDVFQGDQARAELIDLRRGVPLARRVRRQQQARAQLHQPGRHHHPVGLLAQRHRRRRLVQRGGQLVKQCGERDVGKIDFLRARQGEQMVQRSAEAGQGEVRRPPFPSRLPRFVRRQRLAAIGRIPLRLRPGRKTRHARSAQSAGRGTSQNRSAGQRFSKFPTAACGVSPSVKNP